MRGMRSGHEIYLRFNNKAIDSRCRVNNGLSQFYSDMGLIHRMDDVVSHQLQGRE